MTRRATCGTLSTSGVLARPEPTVGRRHYMHAAAFALALTIPLPQPHALSVTDVGWLTGCWEFTRGSRHVSEQWTRADGGTMLGVSRTISNGRTVEYEFIVIRESGGKLEYVAKPSGQPEAVFTSVQVGAGEAIFENPAHDFPTRIRYRRQPDGLVASIEGTLDGRPRTVEFPFRAASCVP